MAVPYTFATATSAIPLSQLDSNFATAITLGSTNLTLGTTTTTVAGLTLTSPVISTISNTGTLTLPTTTDTLVGRATTDTLTNKSISGSANTLTNIPISTAISGLGTGVATALAVNTGSAGAVVLFNGALGTPSSGTLTNCTGYPTSGLSGTISLTTQVTGTLPVANGGTGVTTSTGSGSNVLSTSPTLVTPVLGTPTSVTLTNATGLPISTGLSGLTTNGVAYATSSTALATGSGLVFDGTNLGIGTSSPTANRKLDVVLNSNADSGIRVANTNTGTSASSNTTYANGTTNAEFGVIGSGYTTYGVLTANSAYSYINNYPIALAADGTGYITFGTGSGVPERMRLDSSGNLGLGLTPSAWYSNSKNIQLQFAALNSDLQNGHCNLSCNAYESGNTVWTYSTSNGATRYAQTISGTHAWYNAPSGTAGNAITFTQAMTLDTSGNLLLGTTTAASLTNTNSHILYVSASGAGLTIQHASGTSPGTIYAQFGYNATIIGSITQSGTSAVLYNVTSDQRLKENIVDAPDGNIDQIKIRSFDWKSDGTHNTYGVIAQELLEVAPYAVHQPPNPDEMMGVDYSKLVPMMIKEIQSLKAEVAKLKGA